ncbi:hypothetical protein ACJIZ3_012930 [Penstemon smallii]|uniref:Uncharacterized protein n=1 Tax=Penstemon smallii TaxID=265156 RepID=A0ABD3URA9_9LAMI
MLHFCWPAPIQPLSRPMRCAATLWFSIHHNANGAKVDDNCVHEWTGLLGS